MYLIHPPYHGGNHAPRGRHRLTHLAADSEHSAHRSLAAQITADNDARHRQSHQIHLPLTRRILQLDYQTPSRVTNDHLTNPSDLHDTPEPRR